MSEKEPRKERRKTLLSLALIAAALGGTALGRINLNSEPSPWPGQENRIIPYRGGDDRVYKALVRGYDEGDMLTEKDIPLFEPPQRRRFFRAFLSKNLKRRAEDLVFLYSPALSERLPGESPGGDTYERGLLLTASPDHWIQQSIVTFDPGDKTIVQISDPVDRFQHDTRLTGYDRVTAAAIYKGKQVGIGIWSSPK